jgi:hypothetical protein
VISGNENLDFVRQICKPPVKICNFIKRSVNRRVARVNQNIAVGNFDLFVAIMRVGKTYYFHRF